MGFLFENLFFDDRRSSSIVYPVVKVDLFDNPPHLACAHPNRNTVKYFACPLWLLIRPVGL
jgi:hypothetical protein